VAVVLAFAGGAVAGPSKRVDAWSAPDNRERLKIAWVDKDAVGGASAPGWPFLVYVAGVATRTSEKVEGEILADTDLALSSRLCRFVRVTPTEAIDLPYLKKLPRIQNPMIVVVGKDLALRGTLAEKKITLAACRDLVSKAIDDAYEVTLHDYVKESLSVVEEAERLWRAEEALKADEAKGMPAEQVAARREEIAAARLALAEREKSLNADARLKQQGAKDDGGEEAGLTDGERSALRTVRERSSGKGGPADAFVLDALRSFDSAAMARSVLKLACKDSWHAWQAGRLLAEMDSPGARQALAEAIRKGSTLERVAALSAFFERRAGEALPAVHTACEADGPVREAAVRVLGAQKDGASGELLVRALSDRAPGVRVLAARSLGARADRGAVEPLRNALMKDEDWCVRKAAAEALGAIRSKESIPPLLEAMATAPGILQEACAGALVTLSGQPFGYDLARWKEWWTGASASFVPAKPDDAAAARQQAAAALRGLVTPIKHHGIPSFSEDVIFLLDVAPSMDKRMELPQEATAEQRETLWRGSKLDLARDELVRTLGALPDDTRFNVIGFAGGVKPWRNKLARATYRGAAIDFVKELKTVQPAGVTGKRPDVNVVGRRSATGFAARPGEEHERDILSALLVAFGVFGDDPLADTSRPPADTLFLVVDGQPSAGEIREGRRIVEVIREVNQTRGVTVHVVVFAEVMRASYEPLARATGGTFAIHGQ
jgi:HEAT repeat protein